MIIYSNHLNETELLRSLALKNIDTFNIRVFNFSRLVNEAHIRLGYFVDKKQINNQEALLLLESFIYNIHPFSSFMDVHHAYNTLQEVRMNINCDNEFDFFNEQVAKKMGEDQNIAILKNIFSEYLHQLNDKKLVDQIVLARALIKKNTPIYDEIIVLKEEKLSLLEVTLLKALSKTCEIKSVVDLYQLTLTTNAKVDDIRPYYGEKNEIDGVLTDIARHQYPLDTCLIVLASKDKYVHLLKEDSDLYHLPMTFECGLPVRLSSTYKLYQTLNDLAHLHFFDVNGYKRLFHCDAFNYHLLVDDKYRDDLTELLGRLKINFNQNDNEKTLTQYHAIKKEYLESFLAKVDVRANMMNEAVKAMEKCVDVFSLGASNLLKQYVVINKDNDEIFNLKTQEYILKRIEEANHLKNEVFQETYLDEINNRYLMGKAFTSGALHVTTLNQGLSTVRPHIYLVGFNANNFPGKPREDYLMNNEAYRLLNPELTSASNQRINDKNEFFRALVNVYKSLGVDVHLSYSCKNLEEAKDVNPSSVVFDYAYQIEGFSLKDALKKAKQFDNEISSLRQLADAFNKQEPLAISPQTFNQPFDQRDLLKKNYSPSTLTNFINCPLHFYLTNVLYADLKDPYDSLDIIKPNTYGDLLHLVMEIYTKNHTKYPDEEAFNTLVDDVYHSYRYFNVPLVESDEDYDDFLISCQNTYQELNNGNFELVNAEYNIEDAEINGVKFHGSIDLILKNKITGEYLIYDYKTGRNDSHKDNDFEKDIQGVLYANMYALKSGNVPTKMVFFYTRNKKRFVYDNPCGDETKQQLNELLTKFKSAISSKTFPIAIFDDDHKEKDICKYCHFDKVCPKEKNA